jgi:signal transduction histidine kinase
VKWWSVATQWRNWPLQRKLAMVLVVPILGATVLGVLRVQSEVQLANSYAATEPIVDLRAQLLETVTTLQAERKQAIWGGGNFDSLARSTDAEIEKTRATVEGISPPDSTVTQRWRTALGTLRGLPAIRRQVNDGAEGHIPLNTYNTMIGSVLEFDRALVGRFPDVQLTDLSISLNKIVSAREQASAEQVTGLVALRNDVLAESDRQALIEEEARLDDNLTDLRATAPDDLRLFFERTVSGPQAARRAVYARDAPNPGTAQLPFSADAWNEPFDTTTLQMLNVSRHAALQLRTQATALADDYGRRAPIAAALLIAIVVLAAGIGGVLARYLLRSVETLRRTALEVAHAKLPEAVARIRAGEGANTSVEPVPLHGTEEFGQLARAFDAVHEQAVRSAAEEATLRSNLATILTNLSRRSQGLVERQLRLMEQLEQREDNPDQLSNLFKIDHLATRMRRNNENLMVLSGAGLRRRFTEPVPMSEVLRAAVSEVEHYERAVIRSVPDARVLGHAVGDLIRSISELIENATKFSPPDSDVVLVSGLNPDGSVEIDVYDEGFGMADKELNEANVRVAAGGGIDVPVSRQMGLFVVGRLTARHGIQARLHRRSDQERGMCASVFLPATLVLVGAVPAALSAPPPNTAPQSRTADVVARIVDRLATAGVQVQLSDFPLASSPASILFDPDILAGEPVPGTQPGTRTSPGIPIQPAAPTGPGGSTGPGARAALAAAQTAAPDEETFTWLDRSRSAPSTPAAPTPEPASAPAAAPATGPNGLPKRVPMSQLISNSLDDLPPVKKADANRNRSFLSGFQQGIQASEDRRRSSEP